RILLVEVVSDGLTGWGEITTIETPSYNSETTDTAWHVLSDFIAPLLIGRDLRTAAEVGGLLQGIRGHYMAKAGIENALWDIEAQHRQLPLWKLLGGTREEIACGVSLGIRESPQALVSKVQEELRAGYQRIKLKIKPGKDLDFVAAVRKEFPEILLSVDANSAYRLEDADHLQKLDQFHLLMIEQPLEWDDIYTHAALQARIGTAICLDECINNEPQARAALELGACRIINIKLGRVGGHSMGRMGHGIWLRGDRAVLVGGMFVVCGRPAPHCATATRAGFTV